MSGEGTAMGGRLEGKRAVVTAAANGIGRAAAVALAREGAAVIAADVDVVRLATLEEASGIRTVVLDVTARDAVLRFAAQIEAPHILFNCAGYVHHGSILDCDEDAFDFSFDLNVRAMYRLTRALLPTMIENGGGSIINMASVASSVIGAANRFAYGTTKAAVIGMTRALSADFVGRGIRANAICPGTVDTPSLQGRIAAQADHAGARAAFLARQPMGRLGTADEIAALVVYLASDESAFMSGSVITIDGGWSNI